jgi:hypothetical protein
MQTSYGVIQDYPFEESVLYLWSCCWKCCFSDILESVDESLVDLLTTQLWLVHLQHPSSLLLSLYPQHQLLWLVFIFNISSITQSTSLSINSFGWDLHLRHLSYYSIFILHHFLWIFILNSSYYSIFAYQHVSSFSWIFIFNIIKSYRSSTSTPNPIDQSSNIIYRPILVFTTFDFLETFFWVKRT